MENRWFGVDMVGNGIEVCLVLHKALAQGGRAIVTKQSKAMANYAPEASKAARSGGCFLFST
jgi:hypothetical protein